MHFRVFVSVFCFMFSFAFGGSASYSSLSREDSLEWATWGDSQAFLLKFQRLANDTTVLHGSFTAFYEGRLIISGQFDRNLKSGLWRHYDPVFGSTTAEGNYAKGRRVMRWTFHYADGNLRAYKYYANGKLSGETRSFHPNGSTAMELQIENDSLVRGMTAYYETGDTACVREFERSGSELLIRHRSYYPRGPLFESYVARLKLNSPYLLRTLAQGADPLQVMYGAKWLDPLRSDASIRFEGSYRKYHVTGRLWEHLWYDDGKLFEYYACNDQWGNALDKGDLINGNGTIIRYHRAADTALVASYRSGLRHGEMTFYREAFLPAFKGEFDSGQASGTWFRYDINGRIRKEYRFNGDSTSVREERRNDIRDHVGYFVEGLKEGQWISFDFFGDTASVTHFKAGMKQGLHREFRRGVLFKQGTFDRDVRTGIWKTFNMRGKETWVDSIPAVQGASSYAQIDQLSFEEDIIAAAHHDFSFREAKLPYILREEQVRKIGETYYRVRIVVGKSDGDANFIVEIEDTGHVIGIENITFNRPEFYEHALGVLQNLAFMYPASFEQIPRSCEEAVAFYFEEL